MKKGDEKKRKSDRNVKKRKEKDRTKKEKSEKRRKQTDSYRSVTKINIDVIVAAIDCWL